VFASSHGVLDLLMIAQTSPVTTIAFPSPDVDILYPTGWVYEICERPADPLLVFATTTTSIEGSCLYCDAISIALNIEDYALRSSFHPRRAVAT
jgi:hypothetical protein